MNLTHDEAADLLAELAPNMRQPGDIDRDQAAQAWNMSDNTAAKRLNDKVAEGTLTTHYPVYDPIKKRMVRVWRRV